MAKKSSIGSRKTKIRLFAPIDGIVDGYTTTYWQEIFSAPVWARVEHNHSADIFASDALRAVQSATINMPYTNRLTQRCKIQIGADTRCYDIIGINNILTENRELEIFCERKVQA